MLIYSKDSRNSFEAVKKIRDKLFKMNGRHLPTVLVCNKSDIKENIKVKRKDGKTLANVWDIPYMEISAKNSVQHSIDKVFDLLIEEMRQEEFPESSFC